MRDKFHCPYCLKQTQSDVLETRDHGTEVWRIRQCRECNNKFKTTETIDLNARQNSRQKKGA